MNRKEIFSTIASEPEIPVLIVGAGINGIAVFRDLALNGVDVLLVERGDFCSGASATSSHMAHGGIRYLENGEFRLVREAVQERNRMIRNAPHLVQPLPTTIPIFTHFSGLFNAPMKFMGWLDKPAERGSIIIRLGLLMYDAYTGRQRTVPRHKILSRRAALTKWPLVHPEVVNTAVYYDGLISNPERLALELVLDAETDHAGARALNYTSMVRGADESVWLRDELSGDEYEVRPRLLINAAGPWIDITHGHLGLSTGYIGGTKGSHIVVDHPQLRQAVGDHEFFFENKDGRIVLILPLFDRVLIGTSDLKIDDPDSARCTEEEVGYFIEMVSRVFPSISVRREQIVFRFSGVRPLARSTARTTGQYSRDHSIEVLSGDWTGLRFPVYALVGGKWTSFRAFAEQVTDKTLAFLGRSRIKHTRDLPVGGGRGYSSSGDPREREIEGIAAWTGLPRNRVDELYERYGSRTEAVATFINRAADAELKTLQGYSRREFAFLAEYEKVVHLDDLLLRRTLLAMLGHLTRGNLQEIAGLLGEALGWSEREVQEEIQRTLNILADRHGVNL
jgi:glycerol-3-phosphate dehydrogenase